MTTTTADVLNHHLESIGSCNLEEVMSDYTEDSLLYTPFGPMKGLEAIRELFTGLLEEFAKPGMSFEMIRQDVEGDTAYIIWSAETADNVYEVASDTFFVQDGAISCQSFCAKIVPKA